jgi:putative selenium metabolism protein SsnA
MADKVPDLIIGNGVVVTCDSGSQVIEDGAVAIAGDRVADVGPTQDLKQKYPGAKFEDVGGRLVMPGMTCTHMHLYSTFARGMQLDGEPARTFGQILERLWWRLDRALTEEDVWMSAMMPLIWCVRNGTTTILDHHSGPNAIPGSLDVIADAVARVGMRASLAYEVSDRDGENARDQGIAENVRFIEACKRNCSPLLRATFGLHASFTLSDETLKKCVDAPGAMEAGFHIHTAEGIEDLIQSIRQYGQPVVRRLDRMGLWNDKSLAVHCVHISPEEIEILKDRNVNVVHNPESNMGNAVGAAPVLEMIKRGVRVGLGTDGYTYDMFESIKVGNLIHKHKEANPQAGWAEIPLMAFENNSKILAKYWDVPLGVLTPGAYADVIVVNYWAPTPITSSNWYSHVLFGVSGGMVDSTMVGGKFLMRRGELLTVNEQEMAAKSREMARRVWERA